MNKTLVLGAGGFIGHHLVSRLKGAWHHVIGVDQKAPRFSASDADEFIIGDLRKADLVNQIFGNSAFDEVYQLAADMGGAGFVFVGDNDFDIMHNSITINANVANAVRKNPVGVLFYSSSACVYPEFNQLDPANPICSESSAYPAQPDSEYGWEKLFSERLFSSLQKNFGIPVRIGRYHNIYGPLGSWNDGREKAPAAICRKVAELEESTGVVQIWGDGSQTRSFLYIEDCIDATVMFTRSSSSGPVNIGSEEMISIRDLVHLVAKMDGKRVSIECVVGPTGVAGRNSDNRLIEDLCNWKPKFDLELGLDSTLKWIKQQVMDSRI